MSVVAIMAFSDDANAAFDTPISTVGGTVEHGNIKDLCYAPQSADLLGTRLSWDALKPLSLYVLVSLIFGSASKR